MSVDHDVRIDAAIADAFVGVARLAHELERLEEEDDGSDLWVDDEEDGTEEDGEDGEKADEEEEDEVSNEPEEEDDDCDAGEEFDEAEEDLDDSAGFDLAAFLSLSVARAQNLTVVDRMRRDSQSVAEITLDELIKYIEVNHL